MISSNLIAATLRGLGYARVVGVRIENVFQNLARIGLCWGRGTAFLWVFAKLFIIETEQYLPITPRGGVQRTSFRVCI
jgi:hypothetical protein